MSAVPVGIALSGGVDSTVAAALLLKQGFSVHGFFMQLPLPSLTKQWQQVQEIARALGIPLHRVDLRRRFTEDILGYFTRAYVDGQTPNPCVLCNRLLKFGALAEDMLARGMEKAATGHYARLLQSGKESILARGRDPQKDQSYFLAGLSAAQLARALFPLGEWTKEEVRRHAALLGFRFSGEESQDVCFLPQGLAAFFPGQTPPERNGEIVDQQGRRLGRHQGLWRYTIGQRRGLGLPDASPWYVIALDSRTNRVIVGKEEALFHTHCPVRDLRWTHTAPALPWQGLVQLRSRHRPTPARLAEEGSGRWRLSFEQPQRAPAPGQFAVLYQGDAVQGCAVIDKPLSGNSKENGA